MDAENQVLLGLENAVSLHRSAEYSEHRAARAALRPTTRGCAIHPEAPGGNQWSHDADKRIGMDRYVHLCFFDQHPMEYRAREAGRIAAATFLRVLPAVLDIPGVMFADDVANKAGVIIRPLAEIDAHLDLDVIYTRLDWKDPAVRERLQQARKYEILVPDHVPVALLRKPQGG